MAWRRQARFDAHAGTDFIECMVTARHLVFHREPVGKLRLVVSQDFGDLVILMGEAIFKRRRKSTLLRSDIQTQTEQ